MSNAMGSDQTRGRTDKIQCVSYLRLCRVRLDSICHRLSVIERQPCYQQMATVFDWPEPWMRFFDPTRRADTSQWWILLRITFVPRIMLVLVHRAKSALVEPNESTSRIARVENWQHLVYAPYRDLWGIQYLNWAYGRIFKPPDCLLVVRIV
jgi:hypothetical protein